MRHVLTTLLLLAWAGGAAGQSESGATARIEVGEVLELYVDAAGAGRAPEAVPEAPGVRELRGAVVLRVSANTGWRLVVTPEGEVGEDAGLSWRVQTRVGGAVDWVRGRYATVSRGAAEVARGRAGREIELVVDYRWSGAGTGVPGLVFTLEPS